MFKRSLSVIMCMILAIGSCLALSIPANAEYVSYSGSSSYMSGKYYQQLTSVNLTGNQADDIVNVALSQLGYHEGRDDNDLSGTSSATNKCSEYGYKMGTNPGNWCAYFVSWCARRAKIESDVLTAFSGCTTATVSFKSRSWNSAGVWHDGYILNNNTTYVPKKGDLVFYDWERNFYYNSASDYLAGGVNHVGIVWKDSTNASTVYVVEGNTSGRNVAKRTVGVDRSKTDVVGYFSPAYKSGTSNLGTFSITSPSNMQYLDPRSPGKVTWNTFSGAKSYSYTVREVQYNASTGKYEDTSNYLCTRVCTTAKSFSLDKDENSNLSGYVKNWGAYKIWVGACSDATGSTVVADQIIYVCLNHIAKTPDLKKPFTSSKTQIMSNLYADTYSGTISPDQDLTISWSSEGQSYDYSVKTLSGKPNPGDSESGTTLDSANKYKSTSVTVSKSTLQQYAGQYIKVYLKANDSSCDDSSCAAYYYFKLGESQAEPETYTLTYNANGGNGAPPTQSGNTTYTISTAIPSMDGYSFLGWATSCYAAEADYAAGDSITLTKNTTLYAVWEDNDYGVVLSAHNITVDVNDFSESIIVTTKPAGKSVSFSVEDSSIARFGYQLSLYGYSGAFTGMAVGTTVMTATMQYNGKTYTDQCMVTVTGTQQATYRLSYNLNGGTIEIPIPNSGYDSDSAPNTYTVTSCVPERSGYLFLGWAESSTSKTAQYASGEKITLTQDTTLYAVWQQAPAVPTITYLSIQTRPVKREYAVGETLDTTGLSLTAEMSDGSTVLITSGFVCTPSVLTEEGAQTITVTYEGNQTSFTVDILPVPAIPDNAPQMSLSRTSARVGDRVDVTLSVENNPGFIATSVNLSYDTAVLRLISVENGTLFEDKSFSPGKNLNAMPYTIIWEDGLAARNHTENGILATFTFEVLADAPLGATSITLGYTSSSTFNMDMDEVGFTISGGSIEVVDRTPGDVNADGIVDLKDVVILSRHLSGGWGVTINESNSDVNGDHTIDLKDTVILRRYLSGGWNVELR